MKSGYFQSEETGPAIDPDELDDHDIDPPDVVIQGDGIGPLGPYFEALAEEAHRCQEIARLARARGYDPEPEPEIPFAEDLASRVEALVGPEGVAARIRELSEELGREELALTVSKEVAAGRFQAYDGPQEALDGAIRTGLAILTEGILVAPLEGVADVRVQTNDDGSQYADIYFAGPIRAAGGTGQALSVLIADVVRRELGLGRYRATRGEIERFKEEVPAYKRAANLQYTPSPEEIELIVAHVPVGINGEGTDKEEVSGNRDLPRVETNQLRGGACLVLAEGLTLKAPKILKHVEKLGLEGWGFLDDFVKAQKNKEGSPDREATDGTGAAKRPRIEPNPKYINELVAGRPVFGHPSRPGGFRLRYGRARTAGLAATAVHPAITVLVDDFLAVGTQLKVERPGKGTVVTPCDTVEPPIVRLTDGSVIEVPDLDRARQVRPRVEAILDLGEMLVPFGEFLENNKRLPAAAWCAEWWRLEVEAAGHEPPRLTDGQAARAFALAEETGTPLHPRFTLFWHDLDRATLAQLVDAVAAGRWEQGRLAVPSSPATKEILETLGATHEVATGEPVDELVVDVRCSLPVARGAGFQPSADGLQRVRELPEGEDPLALVSGLSAVELKAKAPCRIGARMGRPEKAAERKMSPAVHTLFPLGKAGGLQRLVEQAAGQGSIGTTDENERYRHIEVAVRRCPSCQEETLSLTCPSCQETTRVHQARAKPQVIPLGELVEQALGHIREPKLPSGVKGVQGLMSEHRVPEPLAKGVLRCKHDISMFKDGTCRFDMTDLPLTHFRPREIGTPVARLREMGYTEDIHGEELTSGDQLLELAPQDIVVNEKGLAYMARVAEFTDDLLTRFYGLKPYYDLETPQDLVGHLAVGLAPHTSGGVLCRIIGSTRAQGHWGHPYFHAAKRRNCFHGDTEVVIERNGRLEKARLRDLIDPVMDRQGRPGDNHGTRIAEAPDGLRVLSMDPQTGAIRRHPVTKFIRGSTERWIEIESSSHRAIRVTPDHNVLVKEGDVFSTQRAAAVDEGVEVPVGLSLPREDRVPKWNLAKELAGLPNLPDVRIRGIDSWLKSRIEAWGRDKAYEVAGAEPRFRKTPSRWYGAFPLAQLRRMVQAGAMDWSEIPDTARLGIARDQVSLPLRLETTAELCRLLGIYLAEGHARSNASAHQVSFRLGEPRLSKAVQGLVHEVFGLQPAVEEDGTKVTVCSRLIYLLFTEIWRAGSNATDKRLPAWSYNLPEAEMVELLSGFFDGDGSILQEPPRLRFYSKNWHLLEDVASLLQALGIFARFVPGKARAPGSFLAARYEEINAEAPDKLDPVHALALHGKDLVRFCKLVRPDHPTKAARARTLARANLGGRLLQIDGLLEEPEEGEHHTLDRVIRVEEVPAEDTATYCLDIDTGSEELATKNVLLGNGLYQVRCDGDEDCIMLLMDGLLNFSRSYLPRTRGGQMDAPLTLSLRIDPREIDKEAHNIESVWDHSLEFFRATEDHPTPKEVDALVETVTRRLGGERQYTELGFTHDTSSIDQGPEMSAYKTIGSMLDKMDGQLGLARKIRAVDAGNVASRVICDHFLPDIVGNLKAFSRQVVRCAKCNSKFRRVPLAGRCPKCKNTLTMTVHEASVKKYVEVAKTVAERYQVDAYTRQRLDLAEEAIDSLFQNDKVKKATLTDFL